jgi:cyanophycin synthetase
LRGRTEKQIIDLIIDGIKESDATTSYEVVTLEIDAIRHAFSLAVEGTYIVALSDVVANAIEIVQEYLDLETESGVI